MYPYPEERSEYAAIMRKLGEDSYANTLNSRQRMKYTGTDNGSISGYFATFHHDHGDSYGDVIRRGAFRDTIRERNKKGKPFPLCLNHDLNTIIGYITDIGEDAYGAYFSADLFSSEKAQSTREILRSGVIWQCSFAYNVLEEGKVKAEDGSTVNELRKLDLFEISVVVVPANRRAEITEVKNSITPEEKKRRRERTKKNALIQEVEEILGEDRMTVSEALQAIEKADLLIDDLYMELHLYEEKRRHSVRDYAADLDFYTKLAARAWDDYKKNTSSHDKAWRVRREKTVAVIRREILELTELTERQRKRKKKTIKASKDGTTYYIQ